MGSVTKEMELCTVNVVAVNGDFEMDVNVTKVEKGERLSMGNLNYEDLINTYVHRNAVQMDDVDKSKLPMHLIFGSGDYMLIKTADKPHVGNTGEPLAEKTKLVRLSSRKEV